MNKSFIVLLAIALGLGVSLGGAFVGGVALGKSNGSGPQTSFISGPAGNFPQSSGQFGPGSGGQFQRDSSQLPSGATAQGEVVPGFRPGGETPPGFGGRGRLSGTIESIEEGLITIKTPEGESQATVSEDTTINKIAEVRVEDLQVGDRVTVIGPSDDSGKIEAASIMITPEGAEGLFGGGSTDQRNLRQSDVTP